jgi:hypothetical protein
MCCRSLLRHPCAAAWQPHLVLHVQEHDTQSHRSRIQVKGWAAAVCSGGSSKCDKVNRSIVLQGDAFDMCIDNI